MMQAARPAASETSEVSEVSEASALSATTAPRRTGRADALLVRAGHFYFIRIILVSVVLGIVLVTTRYTGFTLVNIFLLLFGAAYPHVCRLLIGEHEGRQRRGNINLLIDGFYIGAVMPAIGFATLPCLVMFVINLFNWMAIGGPLLTVLGGLVMLVGLVISGTFSRYAHELNIQDPTLDLLAYCLLLAYFFLISGVIYRYARSLQRRCVELQSQKNAAEIGNRRAERALLAVLPPSAAQELRSSGSIGAHQINDATLLLADFAQARLAELAEYFRACDEIFTRHGLERVKTSNHRYLAIATTDAGCDAALAAAKELQTYLHNHDTANDANVRVFIHCGEVECGLVQAERFNYDVVGHTVDTVHALAHATLPDAAAILLTAAARERLHGEPPLTEFPGPDATPLFSPKTIRTTQ